MNVPPENDGPADEVGCDATTLATGVPFFYLVASNLPRVLHLSKEQHMDLWRRVVDLYSAHDKPMPQFMRNLCQEAFVESLIDNEVFWGLTGSPTLFGRYARADRHLSAVYATAALLAAWRDHLPLAPSDAAILCDRA